MEHTAAVLLSGKGVPLGVYVGKDPSEVMSAVMDWPGRVEIFPWAELDERYPNVSTSYRTVNT